VGLLEVLDEGGDHHGLDGPEVAEPAVHAPVEEGDGVAEGGTAGVGILDGDGEVLGEAGDGVVADGGEDRGQGDRAGRRGADGSGSDRDQFVTGR
jgi:hypothetical protein